jgi:hypothetical protein
MTALLLIAIVLVALDLAALAVGADSRDLASDDRGPALFRRAT